MHFNSILSQNIPGELFYLKFGLSYMGYIGFGFLFSHIIKDKKISKMNYLLITTIGLLFLLIYVLFKFIPDYLFPICMFILIYGFSSLIYNTKICNNSIFRILLANSFYIYLFHDPLNYIILKIVFKYNLLKYSCGPYLYLFSRTILVIIVSIILGTIVENIFLKKIKKMLTK